jgi:hypothetical protein
VKLVIGKIDLYKATIVPVEKYCNESIAWEIDGGAGGSRCKEFRQWICDCQS